jgi:hypothetical protein
MEASETSESSRFESCSDDDEKEEEEEEEEDDGSNDCKSHAENVGRFLGDKSPRDDEDHESGSGSGGINGCMAS